VSARVLVAGTFDPKFARNRVLVSLLRREGFELRFAQRDLWGHDRPTLIDQPKRRIVARAAAAYPRLLWDLVRAEHPDLLLVPYPGYFDMPLVALVAKARGIPIMFDPFISLYDTIVGDRGLRSPRSPTGRAARIADAIGCSLADRVLVDTPSHADYFAEATGVPRDRFRVLWLGAQEDVFQPVPDVLPVQGRVVFHGTFVPLQGLETIVRTAKLLEPAGVHFRIVGDGQERSRIERLIADLRVENVDLAGRVPLTEVPREIASGALCLGIFGTSGKAHRVVPNKVFECLAVGRPVVTADTPASRAAFSGEVETVAPGDPEALAEKIRDLFADPSRLEELAAAGHARFRRDYSEVALGCLLRGYVEELAGRRATASSDGPRSGASA
jgi:glycosyltransferase involved in cell wall biosynthesis